MHAPPHMTPSRALAMVVLAALSFAPAAHAQTTEQTYAPTPGMPGKDAVWVPTSPELTEKMLDMAGVGPDDFVVDLGSGDGRMVIAAAKRGARALGVEYNPDLVKLSEDLARKEGVADKARFVRDDMFAADISKATVLALFLLPEHLRKLTPAFLDLAPGSRIVVNTFGIPEWQPDRTEHLVDGCQSWCEAKLYIVPARVAGTWTLPDGSLVLEQTFQQLSGNLTNAAGSVQIEDGVVEGNRVRFTAGGTRYEGQLQGKQIDWTATSASGEQRFTARRGE
jgi:SAM-dependent methyltransferase